MGGGPTTIDLWDMKPDSANGGEHKPKATAASGISITEHLPKVAEQFKHLSIIRSLSSGEGDHARGTYRMNTGNKPSPILEYPTIGGAEHGPRLLGAGTSSVMSGRSGGKTSVSRKSGRGKRLRRGTRSVAGRFSTLLTLTSPRSSRTRAEKVRIPVRASGFASADRFQAARLPQSGRR